MEEHEGRIQLIFTSPPFPLNRKKRYGNRTGDEYRRWLSAMAPKLTRLLTPTGSIVIEVGNAWEPGRPVMSTLAMRSLLDFLDAGSLNLCQQFVCHNPARLPTPAQWVNLERIRVKDSFTHVWWMSPAEKPKANNRWVLKSYSSSMQDLLRTQSYNSGKRPSGHKIGETSFLTDNGGAIPSSVLKFDEGAEPTAMLEFPNTFSNDPPITYGGATISSLSYADVDQTERTQIVTSLATTNFASSPLGVMIAKTAATPPQSTYYVRDNRGNLIGERTPDGSRWYYLIDGLGSVVAIINDSGSSVPNRYDYDPYGKTTLGCWSGSQCTVANPWRYAGGYMDSTGLVKFGTRYYDPSIGRWTQQDPAGGSIASPGQANAYGYVGGDPTNAVDPTGRWIAVVLFFVAAVIAGAELECVVYAFQVRYFGRQPWGPHTDFCIWIQLPGLPSLFGPPTKPFDEGAE
jgi:RHS repeat-associated protein